EGRSNDVTVSDDKEKEGTNAKPRLQNPLETPSTLHKESAPAQSNGEAKPSEVNDAVVAKDSPKSVKPVVTEKSPLANGIANGC
ncbi:hypothetical protein, partial [Ralstonia pseudosolanacearum]|uniref:hypothetical protein n=1 Tax=Ralstonia pseudosolanacearum TaxID=1310165 RepID=UPI003CF59F4D